MPAHVQMTCVRPDTCGGTCEACCLGWCSVCGGAEAALTTDCVGQSIGDDREQAVANGEIDYIEERGWYAPTAEDMLDFHPRFKS